MKTVHISLVFMSGLVTAFNLVGLAYDAPTNYEASWFKVVISLSFGLFAATILHHKCDSP